jgi:hypothetical protein
MKKKFLLLIAVIVQSYFAVAQKLPTTQQISLRAPSELKIDGLPTEWNNVYQAYNKSTDIFYTISNDDNNLYLIVHASISRSMEKIIEGGISFKVNNSGKKDDKKNIVVLFPLMPLPICKGVLITAGKSLTGVTMSKNGEDITKSLDAAARDKQASSIAKANKELVDNLKEIKVKGIVQITDTVAHVTDKTPYYRTLPLHQHNFSIIALANNDNIKAMTQFDQKGELTYELAIPLKYLGTLSNGLQKFFYNITVNGRGEDGRPGNTWAFTPPVSREVPGEMKDQDLEEPTDFWGEYTLAKKP